MLMANVYNIQVILSNPSNMSLFVYNLLLVYRHCKLFDSNYNLCKVSYCMNMYKALYTYAIPLHLLHPHHHPQE